MYARDGNGELRHVSFIYALRDRLTCEVRYIGQAVDLKQRFRDHRMSQGAVGQWIRIRETVAQGVDIVELSQISSSEAAFRENLHCKSVNAAERAHITHAHKYTPNRLLNESFCKGVRKTPGHKELWPDRIIG